MKYKLKVYSIWEFGQRKDSQGNPHQEDSMFPAFGEQSESDRLFILCDGMGGHDAGEVASATVCEAMSQSIINDGHDEDGVFSIDDFNEAINKAFISLDERDNGAEKKMGTTMTFLKLHNEGAFIAHIGDSRVYHIRPGKDGNETQILFETSDHSLVNDLIKIGELTKEEARQSKQKNVITRAMQPNMSRKPKADIYQTTDIKSGDYFYLCSDGMLEQSEMEDGSSLKNVFSELGGSDENKVEILKSVTEKNRDNHTAFIIHITEVIDPIEKPLPSDSPSDEKTDKFTAIVEDEEASSESTVGVEKENADESIATSSNSTKPELSKSSKWRVLHKPRKLNDKRTWIISLVAVAIIVAAIIISICSIKSCSSSKDSPSKEIYNSKTQKAKQNNRYSQKTRRVKKSEAAINPSVNTAAQAVSSSTNDNTDESGNDNPLQTEPSHSASILSLQLSISNEAKSRDLQSIQDNIKK